MSIVKPLQPNPYDAEEENVLKKLNEEGYDKVKNYADKNLYPHTWTTIIYRWLANEERNFREKPDHDDSTAGNKIKS